MARCGRETTTTCRTNRSPHLPQCPSRSNGEPLRQRNDPSTCTLYGMCDMAALRWCILTAFRCSARAAKGLCVLCSVVARARRATYRSSVHPRVRACVRACVHSADGLQVVARALSDLPRQRTQVHSLSNPDRCTDSDRSWSHEKARYAALR
jgi:hypothetical protein